MSTISFSISKRRYKNSSNNYCLVQVHKNGTEIFSTKEETTKQAWIVMLAHAMFHMKKLIPSKTASSESTHLSAATTDSPVTSPSYASTTKLRSAS